MNFYRGKYRPINPSKYDGDFQNIVYRSMWERQVFLWCDKNPSVISWVSEETVIPYRCATDNKIHRYFMDLRIKFAGGKTFLIEIKPEAQTREPKQKTKSSPKYIKEVMTYVKNQSKWKAADSYAKDRGMIFNIWTEETLKSLGIMLMPKPFKPMKSKKRSPKKPL